MSTQLPQPFDPNAVAPNSGGGGSLPISPPEGHLVVITDDEMKHTQDGHGNFLSLTLTITEGPNAGKSGPLRLNLNNQSEEAVRIALGDLSAICHCVGWLQPLVNIGDLHNKPFRVVVDYQKGKEAEGYTNVKSILRSDGGKPGQAAAQPAVQPAAPVMASPMVATPVAPVAPVSPPMVSPVQSGVPVPPPASAGFPPPVAPVVPAAPAALPFVAQVPVAPVAAPVAPPMAPVAPVQPAWTK